MKAIYFTFILITSSYFCFSQSNEQKIDSIMQTHVIHDGKRPVHNFLLYGKNEKTGFEIYKGEGIVGRTENPIKADYQFRIASITKTFVSVVTLQLVEEGRLKLDDKVGNYISNIDYLNFDEFLLYENKPVAQQITIEQLLRHMSGVRDIFTDKELRFAVRTLTGKKRQYNEEKVVDLYYKYKLNKKANYLPGEGYHYSDMNYMLLGFTIEQITGKSLPQNIRERILEPLGMENTYFEYYEEERGHGNKIDAYYNRINLTEKVNTSYEWAGGGLVSTTNELGLFIQGLFSMKLFDDPKTLEMMIDPGMADEYNSNVGMGIFRYDVNNKSYYGHGGYYGSLMLYNPKDKITFVANIGQSFPPYSERELIQAVIEILESE